MASSILIVEDDPLIRGQLELAIGKHPNLTLVASVGSLEAGYECLNRGHVDVMLVDLGLPDGSGIDLIRYARVNRAPTESMVVTIYADERHVMEALECGATGYILKDAMPEDISETILDLVRGGSPISPVIARALLDRMPHPSVISGDASVLTNREVEVLEYLSMGFGRSEIAVKLSVSVHTIHAHIKHIYRKLAAHSSAEAVYLAKREGLIR